MRNPVCQLMLTLSNLSKRFGPKVFFREVSLRMARGEKMGLVGPNGAGKTTLVFDSARRIRIGRGKDRMGTGNPDRIPSPGKRPHRRGNRTRACHRGQPRTQGGSRHPAGINPTPTARNGPRLRKDLPNSTVSLEAKAKKVLSGLAFQDDFLQARPHPQRRLDYAGPPCPFPGDGTRPADAGRTHQSPRPRDPGLVPGTGSKNFPARS